MGDESKSQWPPVLLRHLGTWRGSLVRLDSSSGVVVDRHDTEIEIGIRGEKYSQKNSYRWEDGRTEVLKVAGRMREDGLMDVWSDKVNGVGYFINKDCLAFNGKYIREGHGAGKDVEIWDLIRLLDDKHRTRTWQVTKSGRVVQVVNVVEDKVSDDDVYFETSLHRELR